MKMISVAAKLRFKILIVDDQFLVREGLHRVLNREKDLEVSGEAGTVEEAMRKLHEVHPDLVILDLSIEGASGLALMKQMRRRYPKLLILILTLHKEQIHADRALRAGANGYIMKRESKEKLLEAIRHVLQGHIYVSKAINDRILQSVSMPHDERDTLRALTDHEFKIFGLIGEGYGTRQIADELTISIKTAESHRERIREKLNLNSTFELVQHAIHWMRTENASS